MENAIAGTEPADGVFCHPKRKDIFKKKGLDTKEKNV